MSQPAVAPYTIIPCRGIDGTSCRFGMECDAKLVADVDAVMQESGWAAFLDDNIIGPLLHHHTFKISVGGCPNGCSRPHVADIGIIRACVPELDPAPCTSCSICYQVCPDKAIHIGDIGPEFDMDLCMLCGQCVKRCPEEALFCAASGYRIVLGGKLGRHPRLATELEGIFSAEQAVRVVAMSVAYYKEHYQKKLRFGTLLEENGEPLYNAIFELRSL